MRLLKVIFAIHLLGPSCVGTLILESMTKDGMLVCADRRSTTIHGSVRRVLYDDEVKVAVVHPRVVIAGINAAARTRIGPAGSSRENFAIDTVKRTFAQSPQLPIDELVEKSSNALKSELVNYVKDYQGRFSRPYPGSGSSPEFAVLIYFIDGHGMPRMKSIFVEYTPPVSVNAIVRTIDDPDIAQGRFKPAASGSQAIVNLRSGYPSVLDGVRDVPVVRDFVLGYPAPSSISVQRGACAAQSLIRIVYDRLELTDAPSDVGPTATCVFIPKAAPARILTIQGCAQSKEGAR